MSLHEREESKELSQKTSQIMKIVYIVHPIAGDIHGNVQKILKIVKEINLTRKDIVPFAPYMADVLAMDDNDSAQRERGIDNDIAIFGSGIVKECWVYGKKISPGMESEIHMAWGMRIPVIVKDPDLVWPPWLKTIATEEY
jgi:hypothetical protein